MIIRILLSLMLGLLSSLLILERDPAIREVFGNYCIEMFESAMHCHMKCTIANIDILSRTIELDDVDVSPREQAPDAWHWTCKHYQIKISLWALLTRKVLSLTMSLEDINARSQLEDNRLAIMPHLNLLISFSTVAALELKSLNLRRVRLSADDNKNGHHIDIGFNSDLIVLKNSFKTVFYWTHGTIAMANRQLFDDLQGSINCDIYTNCPEPKDSVAVQLDCRCTLPQLPGEAKHCFVNGCYDHGIVTAHIKSANGLLVLEPVKVKFAKEGIIAAGLLKFPMGYLSSMIYNAGKTPVISGNCTVRVQALYNNDKGFLAKGVCGIRDFWCGKTKIASNITTTFSYTKNSCHGNLEYNRDECMFDGQWQWDKVLRKGSLTLDNKSQISSKLVPNLYAEPRALTIKTVFNDQCEVSGDYNLLISSNKIEATDSVTGSFEANTHGLSLHGLYNNYSYMFSGSYSPNIGIGQLKLNNEKHEPIIEIHGCDKAGCACKGSTKLELIRPIIKKFTNIDIQGQGTLKFYGMIGHEKLMIKTKLEQAIIRIPQTYMCVTGFDSVISIDPINRALAVNYARIKLYEGSVFCRQAVALFDDTWRPSYFQVPLLIDQCLVNVRKDLFGLVSGNLLVTKKSDALPHINGIILIDKAQLTEKLFSGVLHDAACHTTQGLSVSNPLSATSDLELLTYSPIRVNTPFLEAEARMHMYIKGDIFEPSIAGTVSFDSGQLIFPYRPLNIIRANITLSPGAMTDPLIEIIAKNRIKKYLVSLHIAGSLQNHQITFSSNPPLSNEQILGLLLIGSEEESLGNMVPALVMQNIKPLIFGSGHTKFLEKYFNVILKPLQYIHFVPIFGDQTGRGGLRGKLEIDFNDRWRAMIQNNFNLSEDTKFEVEYMLSDDISIKGGRDEHRDVTAEVEMRWRFK